MTHLAARINLETLKKNIALVRSHVPAKIKVMGVVKCNAYGHGLFQISRTMADAGLDCLVVSGLDEGRNLRKSGINCPVLALNDPLYPNLNHALEYNLSLTVADSDFALRLATYKPDSAQRFRVHIKVDTGLGRFGFNPDQGLQGALLGKLFPVVHGRKCPLIGRPSLAQSMLDVSDISEAVAGSEVILAGPDINLYKAARSVGKGIWEVLLPLLKNTEKTYSYGGTVLCEKIKV